MMKEEETVNLLRYYRHDWMNTVQLLMGYTSLGKMDKVQEKLKESVDIAEQERKLVNLDIPKTAIWVISFNWRFDNFRIDYKVEIDNKNLSNFDEKLHQQLEEITELLTTYATKMEMYSGTLLFHYGSDAKIELELSITGAFKDIEKLNEQLVKKQDLHKVVIESLTNNQYKCTLKMECN
ncbi:Spo0B domain-containing protein [Aquibacillus halophilus]|nr:Spo0B domain-containing protein [Aquibacillus halophilus]